MSMRKFNCKIELAEPCGSASIAEFEVDGIFRGALEWLMLAGHRDFNGSLASKCIEVEHTQKEVIIRLNRELASEVAVSRKLG
jgi:hypothetical protein